MNKKLLIAFLALPILGVLGLVAQKETTVQESTIVRIPITGYDPRNMMYGHYLRFRFDGVNAPDTTSHEYYIPEQVSDRLTALLQKREHKMAVDARLQGKRLVGLGEMYIDDQPWQQFMSTYTDDLKLKENKTP